MRLRKYVADYCAYAKAEHNMTHQREMYRTTRVSGIGALGGIVVPTAIYVYFCVRFF